MAIPRRGVLLVLAGILATVAGSANGAPLWDGTWAGGWENGDGVQIIITSGKVIGVFRGGDYPDILKSQLSADESTLIFAWSGGDGVLRRTGEHDAAFTLHERGKPERSFAVHRE